MSRATARTSGSSSTIRMVSTSRLPRCAPLGALRRWLRLDAGEGLAAQQVLGPGLGVPVEARDLLLVEVLLPLAADRRALFARRLGVMDAQLDDVLGHLGLLRHVLDPPESPGEQHGRHGLPHDASLLCCSALADFAEPHHLGAAVHILAHLTPERLEMFRSAMGIHGRLVGVALHEDVGQRRLAVVERVELAAGLARVDLGQQLLGDRLELLLHARLHLDRGDDAYHALSPLGPEARISRRVLWYVAPSPMSL